MGRIDAYPNPTEIPITSGSTLAYTQVTANQTGITTLVDLTGLTATVTVPAGRRIRITGRAQCRNSTATSGVSLIIAEGGTQLAQGVVYSTIAGFGTGAHATAVVSPTAGIHTYKLRAVVINGGTGVMEGDPADPAYILVEDITGGPDPYPSASVPVGQLGYAQAIADTGAMADLAVVPGLSLNVVVPAGRILRISCQAQVHTTAAAGWIAYCRMDGVGVGRFGTYMTDAAEYTTVSGSCVISPAAGAHTFDVQVDLFSGSGTTDWNAASGFPMFLLVEDITPTPAPATTAPSSTLAYAEALSNQGSITTQVALTGLTATVTVPAGRRIRISGEVYFQNTAVNASAGARLFIKEGGAQLQQNDQRLTAVNVPEKFASSVVLSPSAGTHIYSLTADNAGGGTVTMLGNVAYPAFILVEDITGSGISGHIHTELDDTGWLSLVPLLVNGWISYDNTYGPPRYRRKAGIVYVQGLIKNGSVGAVMAVLPGGFRPSMPSLLFTTQHATGVARIDVESGGNIVGAGSNATWTSLAGVTFPVDQ